jgi:hypothetical protein
MTRKIPIIRTSERTTWRTCPQKWWWGYREGLVGKGLPNYNLWFGTGWHEAMAVYYGQGFKRYPKKARQVLEDYFKDSMATIATYGDDEQTRKFVDALPLALSMWDHYIETYGRDEAWEIIATERSCQVEVYDYEGNPIAIYAFTMDGVLRDHSDHMKIKILEHKTAAMIQTGHLPLDDQAGSYLAFMTIILRDEGLLGPDESIQDIIYNYARKEIYKPDERPVNADGLRLNKDGTVSKNQKANQAPILLRVEIPRSAESRNRLIDRVILEAEEMQRMREDPSLVYKNPHAGPFGCTTCPFFQMCQLHEEGGDWETLRDWQFEAKDPYADHRKAS